VNKNLNSTKAKKEVKPIFLYLFILIVCFILYGQSINNNFNIDDDYVYENHTLVQKGISGIPEIFTSRYNTKDEQYFGYRPLTIAIYAIEFEIFGSNPHTAHFFNIIYYTACCWLLFYFLSIIFKEKYSANYLWLSFIIVLIFAVHAMHTEVVLSIKNREEIVSMILGLTSAIFSLKFFNTKRLIFIIPAVVSLAMAFLAKESAIVFIVLIPLTIIFYKTDIKLFSKMSYNAEFFKMGSKVQMLLSILLIIWMLFYLTLTPSLHLFGGIKVQLHNFKIAINESVAWVLFFVTYLSILFLKSKTENKIKLSVRNIILWSLVLIAIIVIILAKSSAIMFATFFFFLATLIPEKKDIKPLFRIKIFENMSKTVLLSILSLLIISGVVLALAYYIPKQALPETNAPVYKWQNPSFDPSSGIFDKIAVALYSFIYYLKLLLIPFPLRFYYGYKMIPDVTIFHPVVLISLAVHLFMLYYALKGFNKRRSLSYGILFYFIAIFPFANTFFPLTGIIAERMLFVPSAGFSIALVFLILKIFKTDISIEFDKSKKLRLLFFLGILILPNTLISLNRNADWQDRKTLYSHDIEYLENSAKANTLYGNLLIGEVYSAVKKNIPISGYKSQVELAIKYFNQSVIIDSTYSNPWHNLGYINLILFKNYELADYQFTKCLDVDSTIAAAYLNRGITNFYLKDYKQAIIDLRDYVNKNKNYKDKELDKAYLFSAKSHLALGDTIQASKFYNLATDNLKKQNLTDAVLKDIENYFIMVKDFKGAIRISDHKIAMNPNSDQAYVEKGNYYLISGDTVQAIANWEIAFEKFNGNYNIAMTLSSYFRGKGDIEKADYYYNTAVAFKLKNQNQVSN
jgi:hypothetical protein